MKACIVGENDRQLLEKLLPEVILKSCSFVVAAVEDQTICGCAAVRMEETVFYVEYFYVEPEFRKRGAADGMIRLIHRIAMESGMDATVFTYQKDASTSELYDFLLVMRFEDFELYDHLWSMKLSELCVPSVKPDKETVFLELGRAMAAQKNMLRADYRAKMGASGNAQAVLKDLDEYLQDVSILEVENNRVTGAILFEELDHALLLSLLYTKEKKMPVKLLELLDAACQKIRESYPPDTELYMNSLDHHADVLIQKLTEARAQERGMAVTQVYTY